MILLWGVPGDTPLADVRDRLHAMNCSTEFLDQRMVLETEVELSLDGDIKGEVRVRGRRIDLTSVDAVYIRPYDSGRLPSVKNDGAGSPSQKHALLVDDTLLSWTEVTPALVLNRPSAMASNNSKPYQAQKIYSLGFDIPDTLVSTDPEAAESFWARHGKMIYKSVSGTRSIVSQFTPELASRLPSIKWCPTQFQQYIPGIDYRVHVVGQAVFATQIVSDADDYRYAGRNNLHVGLRAHRLTPEMSERCRKLAHGLGLPLAGIDLRQTPEGRWYCFEVNPSPGFSYYEQATGQPIAEAVASLLMNGTSSEKS